MKLLIACAAALGTLALAAPASADQPVRQPSPFPPFTVPAEICGFQVEVTPVVNAEIATTFSSGKTIVTGRFVVQLSGNGKTITENVSGPVIITTDASGTTTFTLLGPSFLFFRPGELGPGTPGQFLLSHGPATIVVSGNGESLDITSASTIDLCAVLADP